MSYNEFLQSKIKVFQSEGFEVDVNDFHSSLKPHQRDIAQWACDKGCGLIAASFGLGKTRIDIQVLIEVKKRNPHAPVLVVAPLGVRQEFTVNDDTEAMKKIKYFMSEFGIMDIKMRMLRVPELLRIQGFSDKYYLAGNQSHQKKFIGNSVPPPMVKALIEAMYIGLNKLENVKVA